MDIFRIFDSIIGMSECYRHDNNVRAITSGKFGDASSFSKRHVYSRIPMSKIDVNAIVNGVEDGQECRICHFHFNQEDMFEVMEVVHFSGYGFVCKRCALQLNLRECCVCHNMYVKMDYNYIIPRINFIPEDEGSDILKDKFENSLIPMSDALDKDSYVIPSDVLSNIINFISLNIDTYTEYKKLFEVLTRYSENYGKYVCRWCKKLFKLKSKNKRIPSSFDNNWIFPVDRLSCTFTSKNIISKIAPDIANEVERDAKKLKAFDRELSARLEYHYSFNEGFLDSDIKAAGSKKGFVNSLPRIKRMVIAGIKASLRDFTSEMTDLLELNNDDVSSIIDETIVNSKDNTLDVLLIFPNSNDIDLTQDQISELFHKYIINRKFYNYHSKEGWNVTKVNSVQSYIPKIKDYNIDIETDTDITISASLKLDFN